MRQPPAVLPIRLPDVSARLHMLVLVALGTMMAAAGEPKTPPRDPAADTVKEAVRAANEVLADPDMVRAAKSADKVFAAARALAKAGETAAADAFYGRALQLSPWNFTEQLSRAELLMESNRRAPAMEIARMVDARAEDDLLCNRARRLMEKPEVAEPATPNERDTAGPWICLVRVGTVNRIAITDTMEKLAATLGIPVFVHPAVLEPGPADRSAFTRWVRTQLVPGLNWKTPEGKKLLAGINATDPAAADPHQLVPALVKALRAGNLKREADSIEQQAESLRRMEHQWDAEKLMDKVSSFAGDIPHRETALVIGVTEHDLYAGESNFLFGAAATGRKYGVVSYARFRADPYDDPPQRQRLVTRMHKQLLATTGFALGVPRPTDPTSARSYPKSLPEHDAKSEFMSAECIAGFEKALQRKLPAAAHKPVGTP